jgi:hypothetical protein
MRFIDMAFERDVEGGHMIDADDITGLQIDGYIEHRQAPGDIYIGPRCRNWEITARRWSYPMWRMLSPASSLAHGRFVLAGQTPGEVRFENPDLSNITPDGRPVGLVETGGGTAAIKPNPASAKGASHTLNVRPANAAFMTFKLSGKASDYFERTVTVRLRFSLSHSRELRLATRFGGDREDHLVNGQYYFREHRGSEAFREMVADLTFDKQGSRRGDEDAMIRLVVIGGAADIAFSLDKLSVVDGAFSHSIQGVPETAEGLAVVRAAVLDDQDSWPNRIRKSPGKTIFAKDEGRLYVAHGADPGAHWTSVESSPIRRRPA